MIIFFRLKKSKQKKKILVKSSVCTSKICNFLTSPPSSMIIFACIDPAPESSGILWVNSWYPPPPTMYYSIQIQKPWNLKLCIPYMFMLISIVNYMAESNYRINYEVIKVWIVLSLSTFSSTSKALWLTIITLVHSTMILIRLKNCIFQCEAYLYDTNL